MTEKEMMKQMQDLLGIRKKPSEKEAEAIALADSVDELAEMFCDSAIVLSRIASLLQGKKNPWDTKNFEDMDGWDEEDMACMDATVLFAVPGKPVQLMTEEDALSKFPGFDDEQTFYCVEIGDHLFLHYMEHSWESEDDITITAPVYIARVNDDETECEELKHVFRMYDTDEPVYVQLYCHVSVMKYLIDKFGSDFETVVVDDEHFKATVSVCPSTTFYSWVFGFNGKIKVEGPQHVAEAYKEMLVNALGEM